MKSILSRIKRLEFAKPVLDRSSPEYLKDLRQRVTLRSFEHLDGRQIRMLIIVRKRFAQGRVPINLWEKEPWTSLNRSLMAALDIEYQAEGYKSAEAFGKLYTRVCGSA